MAESVTTKVVRLETQMANIETKVDHVETKVDLLDAKIDNKFDQLMINLDKRYASKLTESIVYALIALILIAFMAAVIKLVVKQPTQVCVSQCTTTTSQNPAPAAGTTSTVTTTPPTVSSSSSTTAETTPTSTPSGPSVGSSLINGIKGLLP